jgi:hypothetical protein
LSSSSRNGTSPPGRWSGSRVRQLCAAGCSFSGLRRAVLLLVGCVFAGGCSDAQINDVVVKIFEPKRTPQQQMLVAFASEDADLRRAALAKVAQSKQRDRDWAIKGYVAIALLDTDAQSRCVAIRALANSGDPRAVVTALKLLNYREYPPQEVRPPEALCRWDATESLADMSLAGQIPDDQKERTRTTLIERLRTDVDRHVRIAAARGLGCYAHEECVKALVERLSDDDFAVVHECELSLTRLTGQTFGSDAVAWEDWLAANHDDLFAHAGDAPDPRGGDQNWLRKAGRNMNDFVHWIFPGRKEQ